MLIQNKTGYVALGNLKSVYIGAFEEWRNGISCK